MSGVGEESPGWTVRLAHSIPKLILPAIAVRVLSRAFANTYWWASLADILFSTVMMVAFFVMLIHVTLGGLCIQCMREIPDNGSQVAEKNMWFLWLCHIDRVGGLTRWVYYAALIGAMFAAWKGTGSDSVVVLVLSDLPISVWFFGLIWSNYLHHRLRLWCPWCKDDGGWSMVEEVPDPVIKTTKD